MDNISSDEERKIILPDGSNSIYIFDFITPKPTSAEDFKKFGRRMLDSITVSGAPNN